MKVALVTFRFTEFVCILSAEGGIANLTAKKECASAFQKGHSKKNIWEMKGMYYLLQRQFSPQAPPQPHPLPKPPQLNSSSRGNMLLMPPKLSRHPSPSLQFPPSPPPKNSSNGHSPLIFMPSFSNSFMIYYMPIWEYV